METLASFIFNAIRLKGTFLGPEPKAVAVTSLRLFLHKYDYESSKGYYEFLISLTIDKVFWILKTKTIWQCQVRLQKVVDHLFGNEVVDIVNITTTVTCKIN